MKHLILIIIFSLRIISILSQTSEFISFNSNSRVNFKTFCIDNQSCYYIVGTFKDSLFINHDRLILTSDSENHELFVCKLNNHFELQEIAKFENNFGYFVTNSVIKPVRGDSILLAIQWIPDEPSELIIINNSLQILRNILYPKIIRNIYVINNSDIYIHTINSDMVSGTDRLVKINLNIDELWSIKIPEAEGVIATSKNNMCYQAYKGDTIIYKYINALGDEKTIDFRVIFPWGAPKVLFSKSKENLIITDLYHGKVELFYANDTIKLESYEMSNCGKYDCPVFKGFYTRIDTLGQKKYYKDDGFNFKSIDYNDYMYNYRYTYGTVHPGELTIIDTNFTVSKSISLPNSQVVHTYHLHDSVVLFMQYTDQIFIKEGDNYKKLSSLGDEDILIIKKALNDLSDGFISDTIFISGKIDKGLQKDKIEFYPNPAENYIEIVTENNHPVERIQIYNSSGILVKAIGPISEKQIIDIAELTNGFYLIQFFIDNLIITKKLIVNRISH